MAVDKDPYSYSDLHALYLEKLINLHATYITQGVETASIALSKRLEGMNEIRDQLTDQANRLATKDYTDGLEGRLRILESGRSDMSGWRSGLTPLITLVVAVISALVGAFVARSLGP